MASAPFFVPGTLANPVLQLFSGQTIIAQNDNWQDTQQQEILATGLDPCQPNPGQFASPPGCAQESALVVTLPPGAYTAILTGAGGGTGVALVEVFQLIGATSPQTFWDCIRVRLQSLSQTARTQLTTGHLAPLLPWS